MDNLNVGVYRNSADGSLLEANPALVEMTEANSKEEFLVRNVSEFYDDSAKRQELITKLIKQGFIRNEEGRFVTFTGKKTWASVSAVLKKDSEGNTYIDGTLHDITERRQTAEELRRASGTLAEIEGIFADRGGRTWGRSGKKAGAEL